MNNPSPLVPQGSFLEQKNKSRARVRLAVFCVLSIHIVALMALLMQGCRKPTEPEVPAPETNPLAPSSFEQTNPPAEITPAPETNVPVPPPVTETSAVPAVPPPAVVAPSGGAQQYTVAKGDSFYSIAKKFGVSMRAIEDANPGVQPTRLKIGQTIQIPPPSGTAPAASSYAAAPAAETNAAGQVTYKVKSGDTLSRIARHFHTTVRAIRSENHLTTDRIKVGQKLKIPVKETAPAAVPAPAETSAPAATPPDTNLPPQ